MKNVILFFIFWCSTSQAFTLNNSAKLAFDKDEVLVNVAAGFCSQIGITDEELLNIVGESVERFWNQAPTSRLKLKKGSLVNVSLDFKTANICNTGTNCVPNPTLAVSSDILVSCNNNTTNFTSSAILAVTIPNNISGKNILGSLVLINDQVTTQVDTKSRDEKISIIAHEIGHAIGLGHSPVTDSLMYYATMSQRKALGRDDIDGISYLYPKKQPLSGCGTIDTNKNPTNWWGGLFLGLSLVGIFEAFKRSKRSKLYT